MSTLRKQFNTAIILALVGIFDTASAQQCSSVRRDRVALLAGGFVVAQAGVIVARHSDWWTTPATSFHMVWDGSPNREQDGLLHAAFGYHTTQLAAFAWDWACVGDKTAAWLAFITGITIALPKEIGDGLHVDKGFSVRDFTWSASGAALPSLHRTFPVSRSVLLKGWYWPSSEFRNRVPGGLPQLENDYAGQRYFLAFNPGRLPGGSPGWPSWLGIAVGHSVPYWISQPPIHEWYFAMDLNLRGLGVRAPWWSAVATVLDQIHFPLPGVRLRNGTFSVGLF